jgi:cytochrome b561
MTSAFHTEPSASRYDGVTIFFHWATALLVVTLFVTAMGWTYAPRDWGLRSLRGVHVSMGLGLTAAIAGRLVWRAIFGRRLPGEGPAVSRILARLVHLALYVLLIVQIILGIGLRWFSGDALSFFGLFSIPTPFAQNRDLGDQLEQLHLVMAWSLVVLAFSHAVAALVHQYVVKDSVLQRMFPAA